MTGQEKNSKETLRESLNVRLTELAEAVTKHRSDLIPQPVIEYEERAGEFAAVEMATNLQGRRLAEIQRICDKLANLDHIDGICEGCLEEIPAERLEAKLATTHCVACQSKRDGTSFQHTEPPAAARSA